MSNSTLRRALSSARLAISAESIGSDHEADAAARRAGSLARQAGLSLDDLYITLQPDGIVTAELSWHVMVDGWYDAAQEVRQ